MQISEYKIGMYANCMRIDKYTLTNVCNLHTIDNRTCTIIRREIHGKIRIN